MNGWFRHKDCFIADQRGAVALETPIVYLFMILFLLLPIADVAVAGFQYVSAWQALRAFGQSIQYATPPNPASASAWATSARAKADPAFPVPSIQIICGDGKTDCSDATLSPKYYSFTTTVTLAPMLPMVKSALCTSNNANPCSFTLSYSERFQ